MGRIAGILIAFVGEGLADCVFLIGFRGVARVSAILRKFWLFLLVKFCEDFWWLWTGLRFFKGFVSREGVEFLSTVSLLIFWLISELECVVHFLVIGFLQTSDVLGNFPRGFVQRAS